MWGRSYALGFAAVAVLALGCGGSVWKPPPAGSPIPPPGEGMDAGDELAMLAGEDSSPTEAPPPKRPSPIVGELPTVNTPLAVQETCDEKACGDPKVFAALGQTNAPVGIWTQDFAAAGDALTLTRNQRLDVYGVVLSGSVHVGESKGKGQSVTAGVWTAFHASGAGVKISALAPTGTVTPAARVVLAVVAEGTTIGEALKGFKDPKDDWKKRTTPIEAVDLRKSDDLAWAGNSVHARLGFHGAGQRASLSLLIASKDAVVPRHNHASEWELLAILKGDGTMEKGKKPGDSDLTSKSIGTGKIVAIPVGVDHAFVGSGKESFAAIQLYAPPGPEQRFKKLAADAK